MLSIRSNTSSLSAQRSLSENQSGLDSALGKLSSGFRITKAQDDAAGLGVSANLTAQVRSYAQASRNANDGLSVVQTAEASLNEAHNILTRMRELAMQSASDGVGSTERDFIEKENVELKAELDRIQATTEFNGNSVFGASFKFQVGLRSTADSVLEVDLSSINVSTGAGGLNVTGIDLSQSADDSHDALDDIDAAINTVSGYRATLGAAASRLQSSLNTIAQASEAISAANSRIRDVDVASETSQLSRQQVLVQAGVAVLAQANQAPQVALKLLG